MDSLRYCGSCTLCCLVLDIPELDKKAGEWCKHCTEEGCSIHEERPDVCKGFNCLWRLMEKNKDKKGQYRPDKLGVVMIHKDEIKGYSPAVQFNAPNAEVLNQTKVLDLANRIASGGTYVALVSVAKDTPDRLMLARGRYNE